MKRRCACRPGCLSWLRPDDQVVQTVDGPVLLAHLSVLDASGAARSSDDREPEWVAS